MLNCSSGTNPSANASGTIFCVAIIFCLIREAMFWNCITTKKGVGLLRYGMLFIFERIYLDYL